MGKREKIEDKKIEKTEPAKIKENQNGNRESTGSRGSSGGSNTGSNNNSGNINCNSNSNISGWVLYPAVLLALCICYLIIMVAASAIPYTAVEKNLTSAAEYYRDADDFEQRYEKDKSSVVHNYADAVTLNIIASQDSEHPVISAVSSRFYQDYEQTQGKNFYDKVMGQEANTEYSRYWHGFSAILKLLFLFMDLSAVKLFFTIVLAALILVYLWLLLRLKQYGMAAASAAAVVMVKTWLVPQCFEYLPCFLVMFAAAIFVLLRGDRIKNHNILFLAIGSITCFFDFLTCEVLTLGLPLMCLFVVSPQGGKKGALRVIRLMIFWLMGYGLTYVVKWMISVVLLDISFKEAILGKGLRRFGGGLGIDAVTDIVPVAAVVVNLSMIFPFSLVVYAGPVKLMLAGIVFVLFCVWYLLRREDFNTTSAVPMLLTALMPLGRFFAVGEHSAMHPFFTYRSLFLTVVGVYMFMEMSLGGKRVKGAAGARGVKNAAGARSIKNAADTRGNKNAAGVGSTKGTKAVADLKQKKKKN